MTWCIWVIVAASIVILFLYHTNIKVNVEIKEDGCSKEALIQIHSIWFKMNKNYNYPNPDFSLLESIIVDRIEGSLSLRVMDINFLKKILNIFPVLRKYYYRLKNKTYYGVYKKTLNYLIIDKLNWQTTIGCEDAMHTALSTGSMWACKGIVISMLSRSCKLEDFILDVKPDFSKPVLSSSLNCILKMSMAHYIFIAMYAIVLKVRWCVNGFTTRKTEPAH